MEDHVCEPFRMRCDAYPLEAEGRFWVLHVFMVEGETDDLAVVLSFPEREDLRGFQDGFDAALLTSASRHKRASGCTECRPRDRDEWETVFNRWVREAYMSMASRPSLVPQEDVPEVVRLSLECVYNQGSAAPSSALN